MSRAILTIATGKPIYWNMARELARSFRFWNRASDIGMFILTDLDEITAPEEDGFRVLRVEKGRLGQGFSAKLHLDEFAPADQTLFVDADCLCVRPLDFIFERFAGRAVSVVGGTIAKGEWFGDVEQTCRQAGVAALPKFNGGIYYLEHGAKVSAVYQRARSLLPKYDEMGLVRLRGLPNDELLMAVAMAQENCWGIPDDGAIIGDFQATPKVNAIDVVRGICDIENPPPPDSRHRNWNELEKILPAILHFLGSHVSTPLYRREVLRVRAATDFGLPAPLASAFGAACLSPAFVAEGLKDALRPAFHAFFGPRKVKVGPR